MEGGARWVLLALCCAALAFPAFGYVPYYLSKYNQTTFPTLAAMGQSGAGLLAIVESAEMRDLFGLDWIPKDLTTSPGSNALVDAAQAYAFMYPMVQVMNMGTLVWADTNASYNKFSLHTKLGDSNFSASAPNADTLYSSALLDLRQGPVTVNLPDMTGLRYWSCMVYDMYTNIPARIGSRYGNSASGSHFFYWKGASPDLDPAKLAQKYDTVWEMPHGFALIINRQLVENPETDVPIIAQLQREMNITFVPKNRPYVRSIYLQPGFKDRDLANRTITLQGRYAWGPKGPSDMPSTIWWFSLAANMLSQFSPQPKGLEEPWASSFARLGITPEAGFDKSSVGPLQLKALDYGITLATHVLQAISQEWGEIRYGEWQYSLRCGRYGESNFWLDTYFAKYFYLLNKIEDAAYLTAYVDHDGDLLSGANGQKYKITVPASKMPILASGWWSLTIYNDMEELAANPINRYTMSDRISGIQYNADGSLTTTLSYAEPTDPLERANWLPLPDTNFFVVLRLYDPTPDVVAGLYAFVPLLKA